MARLAAQQFGVVSLEQLQAIGLSYERVRGRVQRGALHRLHRGVFAVGHRQLVAQARLIAALLACGSESFLSHRTAAAVWGLREISTHQIEVTVVARLLIELAPRERPSELDRLITQAVRKRVRDLAALELGLERHARRPGLAKLKAALKDYRPRADRRSDLERAFDRLIAGTDIPPPLRNVTVDGWEIDCYWPQSRLPVELDGRPYHVAVRDLEKDRLKHAKLLRKGIRVLRFTDHRLSLDPRAVLDDVRAVGGFGSANCP